ncbi:phage holin, LLH family [Paenibacillus sp. KR2-11]|uniref:phage holin, LLH family n=1 Tax=Paenibacillus sp. KR2-11 TaxID=3385500 RepID=UPI0038FC4C21
MIMEIIQPFVNDITKSVLTITALLLLAGLNQVKSKALELYKAKTTDTQREVLKKVGVEAFAHAETLFKGMGGEAKLDAAFEYASKKLGQLGINLSAEEIKASIHKAWLDHNAKVQPIKLIDSGTSSDQKVI